MSRLDRRNVELSTYCSVDADSHFILAMHTNFDGRVDPFEVNAESARRGDLASSEAFRKYARYWLAGDELGAGRAMARRNRRLRSELLAQIEGLYVDAASRKDVENIERHCQSNWTKPQELAIEDSQAASWRHSVRAAARCCLYVAARIMLRRARASAPGMTMLHFSAT